MKMIIIIVAITRVQVPEIFPWKRKSQNTLTLDFQCDTLLALYRVLLMFFNVAHKFETCMGRPGYKANALPLINY